MDDDMILETINSMNRVDATNQERTRFGDDNEVFQRPLWQKMPSQYAEGKTRCLNCGSEFSTSINKAVEKRGMGSGVMALVCPMCK